jgi:hypothetical protein
VRVVNYTGAGLSLGEEIDVDLEGSEWAVGLPEGADKAQALTDYLWDKVGWLEHVYCAHYVLFPSHWTSSDMCFGRVGSRYWASMNVVLFLTFIFPQGASNVKHYPTPSAIPSGQTLAGQHGNINLKESVTSFKNVESSVYASPPTRR